MLSRRELLVRGGLTMGAAMMLGDQSAQAASTGAQAATGVTNISVNVNGLVFDGFSAGPTSGVLVLCCHGFPQFADIWIPVLEALGALGFHAVALNLRGYALGAQPTDIGAYTNANIVSDIVGMAAALGAETYHLIGHDFGAFMNWQVAAQFPKQILTLTSLGTPHRDAYSAALGSDGDQQTRSAYIPFFQEATPIPENFLLANNANMNAAALRAIYQGENPGGTPPPGGLLDVVPASEVNTNIQRFSAGTTLTTALNWYKSSDLNSIGSVSVPVLYIWGDQDQALGKTAAVNTAKFCSGIYTFVQLAGRSHWLLEEVPNDILTLIQQHLTVKLT